MFNRPTVKTLLQTTLVVLAAVAIMPLAVRAWDAWRALRSNALIVDVAAASEDAFEAMVALRSDRNSVPRSWNAPDPIASGIRVYIKDLQEPELRGLRSAVTRLDTIEFGERARLLPALRQSVDTLTRLQTEFWDGVAQPVANRRKGLAEEYVRETITLQATLEDISRHLFATIQHRDAAVDQMMAVKQLAWRARDSAGDASVMISKGIGIGSLPAATYREYDAKEGETLGYWRGIEDLTFGTALSPAFDRALANAKQVYFAAGFKATREKALAGLVAGVKPEMSGDEWGKYVVPKLAAMLVVAKAALASAMDRAELLGSEARQALILDATLLLLVLGGSIAAIIAVNRRVIQPLNAIRDAMSRLASGTLTETEIFPQRNDEIGALVIALRVFQTQAVQKTQLEQTDRESRARDEKRQQTIGAEIRNFEDGARSALSALTRAATQMGGASSEMEAVSARTSNGMQTVAGAAEETSGSVTGIAAASEQLSGSINEISRHVAHATGITGRAVEETRRTDTIVRGLAEAAGRIGEVVKLINDIAGRTNLLALNATIEAARAGDAGKGFAVVASEVKSLATQTAKATEDIARQITEVQNVTDETVKAIRLIATTIDEVNDVATSIAAGVEQQGASTQEIARNVQQAAHRTREMSETIALVSRDAQVADSTARDVKSASLTMVGEAETLRQRVDTFLEAIRAA
jgi:methyl-accepting chemotaxis protein